MAKAFLRLWQKMWPLKLFHTSKLVLYASKLEFQEAFELIITELMFQPILVFHTCNIEVQM